jgi:hypothetical protein
MATMTQKLVTKTFTFYLDAWLYANKHGIKNYKIKKTGMTEMTLTYSEKQTRARKSQDNQTTGK